MQKVAADVVCSCWQEWCGNKSSEQVLLGMAVVDAGMEKSLSRSVCDKHGCTRSATVTGAWWGGTQDPGQNQHAAPSRGPALDGVCVDQRRQVAKSTMGESGIKRLLTRGSPHAIFCGALCCTAAHSQCSRMTQGQLTLWFWK